MRSTDNQTTLAGFKTKVIDQILVIVSVLALVTQVAGMIRTIRFGLGVDMYITWAGVIGLVILALLRKRLSVDLKINSLIIIILFTLVSGLYSYGFLASSKFYIPVVPILLTFILPPRKTVIYFLILLTVYLIFGFLYWSGELVYSFDLTEYSSSKSAWILDTGVILLPSLGFLYYSYQYNIEVIGNYRRIESQNMELIRYKDHLEALVSERTLELNTTNKELARKNEELNSALENLNKTQENLIQSEKMASLGILTAGIAHEINNPVNYIFNGALAIENHLKENSPAMLKELNPFFGAINTGIERTTGIVKSLSAYSRNEETRLYKCNINEVIDNCLIMLSNELKTRIDVVKHYSEEIPYVMANEGRLHQAFLNILNNAVQAIEGNGKITVRTTLIDDTVEISIEDTGIGIAPENLKFIYDPFFTTKDPGKGTGLGLSITRRIVHEHSGTIRCISKVHEGTEFILNFPLNF